LGWAEIRHPFHPLRGQRFPILKSRRVSGAETLILREPSRGSFAVRREWTDLADIDASCGSARRLAIEPLLVLVALVEDLLRAQESGEIAP
jgi:Family of unknown function (DUF5372)